MTENTENTGNATVTKAATNEAEAAVAKARPCPFCGGKAYVYDLWKTGLKHKIWKIMCGARVDCCFILNDFDTPEDAVKAWNGTGGTQHDRT